MTAHKWCLFSVISLCFVASFSLQIPDTLTWSWNPGARCVHAKDAAPFVYPVCLKYFPNDTVFYVDDYWEVRSEIMKQKETKITSLSACVIVGIQFYCTIYYRPCVLRNIPNFGEVATGISLCNDYCPRYYNTCIGQLLDYGLPIEEIKRILSCYPLYPPEFGYNKENILPVSSHVRNYTSTIIVWDNERNYTLNYTDSCYNDNFDTYGDIPDIICPDVAHKASPTECALNCPEPLISDLEYDISTTTISILGWISFLCCAFICLLQIMKYQNYIMFPNFSTFFFIVSVMCLSWAFCLTSLVGYKNLWCSSGENNLWGDFWCTIQGITYSYFLLASSLWWLACSIFMLVTILKYKPHNNYIWKNISQAHVIMFVTHLLCWGVPLIIVIIALINEKIGYGGSDFWCTIHSGLTVLLKRGYGIEDGGNLKLVPITEEEQIDAWNLALITIPIYLNTLIGTIILLTSLVILCIRTKFTKLSNMSMYAQLILLLFLYICIYTFMLSSKIEFTARRSDQNEEFAEYYNCVTKNLGSCSTSSKVNFPLWLISSILISSQGIYLFLIYGTTPRLYSPLVDLWNKLRKKKPTRGIVTDCDSYQAKNGDTGMETEMETMEEGHVESETDHSDSYTDEKSEENLSTIVNTNNNVGTGVDIEMSTEIIKE